MKTVRGRLFLPCLFVLLVILGMALNSRHVAAQQGPPNGLAVRVVNEPLEVTGTTTVSGSVTAHIVETPFFQSSSPTCDVANRCSVKFPAVPANKRLRVKRLHGAMFNTNADAFVALDLNNFNTNVFVLPLHPFPGAYLGFTLSFNEATDVVFEAGQSPIVEMGTTGTFDKNTFNRLGITGDLIDVP